MSFRKPPPLPAHDHALERRKRDIERLREHKNSQEFLIHELRYFQLSEYVYSELAPTLSLENKLITLHCVQIDFLGDVGHLFNCAEAIRKFRPDYQIKMILILQTLNEEVIRSIFPVDQYDIKFERADNPYVPEEERENLKSLAAAAQAGATLGISFGIDSKHYTNNRDRVAREYGLGRDQKTKMYPEKFICMGLGISEEGVLLPNLVERNLNTITTPWIKNALMPGEKIYHMHLRTWHTQMLAIQTLANITSQNQNSISIIMTGLKYTLKDLIDWKALDIENLKRLNVGKLTRITPGGAETNNLLQGGKEIKLICGPVPKLEMEAIQQASEDLFGCGGDVSFGESVTLDKILLFYDIYTIKGDFFDTIIDVAKANKLGVLSEHLRLIKEASAKIPDIENVYRDTEGRPMWPRGFYSAEPSRELDVAKSLTRLALKLTIPEINNIAKEIAANVANPKFQEEAHQFNKIINAEYNFVPRLISMVDKAIIQTNYPALIEKEKAIQTKFLEPNTDMTIAQVQDELRAAMTMENMNRKQHRI